MNASAPQGTRTYACKRCGSLTVEHVGSFIDGDWYCYGCAQPKRNAAPTSGQLMTDRGGPYICEICQKQVDTYGALCIHREVTHGQANPLKPSVTSKSRSFQDAYDELRAENRRLRTALTAIMAFPPGEFRGLADELSIFGIAKHALSCSGHETGVKP